MASINQTRRVKVCLFLLVPSTAIADHLLKSVYHHPVQSPHSLRQYIQFVFIIHLFRFTDETDRPAVMVGILVWYTVGIRVDDPTEIRQSRPWLISQSIFLFLKFKISFSGLQTHSHTLTTGAPGADRTGLRLN